eukprot:jgi/Ulvmu1/6447/UM003_0077.1
MCAYRATPMPSGAGGAPRPRVSGSQSKAFGAHLMSFLLSWVNIYGKNGRIQCPPVVVAIRKFVSSTPVCKAIRPQPVQNRLASLFALACIGNVPPGMVKEHFDKFSPEWIATVHASVPVVGALRKAIVLPPYAILITIVGSVMGQIAGGKLERYHMEQIEMEQANGLFAPQLAHTGAEIARVGGMSVQDDVALGRQVCAHWCAQVAASSVKNLANPWAEV